MKLRTTSIGLPKTHARIARKHVEAREVTRPLTMPVSVLGDFMLTYLAFEHDQRTPRATIVGVDYGKPGDYGSCVTVRR